MKDVLVSLFSSRKFLIVFLVTAVLVPLVYLGRISFQDFKEAFVPMVVALIAAIGVEGAAEKWNAPPPAAASGRATSGADSLKPPKLPAVPPLPVLLCLALALPLLGCLDPKTMHDLEQEAIPAEKTLCIFAAEEAGMSPDASAAACGVAVDIVNRELAKKHAKAAGFRRDAGAPKDASGQ